MKIDKVMLRPWLHCSGCLQFFYVQVELGNFVLSSSFLTSDFCFITAFVEETLVLPYLKKIGFLFSQIITNVQLQPFGNHEFCFKNCNSKQKEIEANI